MARVRTVEFLPEIFQTDTNRQFLAATLDQLVQEPAFRKTQGFIGRKIGPGVNPNDKYIVEPDKTRADYQLEVGIVSLESDTNKIQDVMTYPGLLDSISYQGGNSGRPDRLFESQYYTWDPFINWDSFINFSQYFWLPNGPDAVDVSATGVPATDSFAVNRNGNYKFSGVPGSNPTLELVRGGSYTFQVAQNQKETINFRVTNLGSSAYVIDFENNPKITLMRGNTYVFTLNLDGNYPFYIKTLPTTGLTNIYNQGVTNNGARVGTVTFTVPQDAPDTLYYASSTQSNMQGEIVVQDAVPGTGNRFWIQTDPGITGRIPTTPNISSRSVLGVSNNGIDLGTVTFNVPLKTDQNFFYDLPILGTVDLVSDLKFNQIQGAEINAFLSEYGGIDGLRELNGRTLIFSTAQIDTDLGGWYFSPGNPVPLNERFSIWQINYVTVNSTTTMSLVSVQSVPILNKFSILYGTQWANTSWFKNDGGIFRQVPLLTAALDNLWYQDGSDPKIFGRIRLIDIEESNTIFIDEILGREQYTSPNGVIFTNGLKVVFRGEIVPESYINQEYYVSGVGESINLLPVTNFITPESYVTNTGSTVPQDLDYLTINRAARDLNAWSRSNRWFHIDVLNATATYNNTPLVIDNSFRAKRPIIEFRPGLHLYNMGTEGKQPVNIIDFTETDAFSNIEGSTGYTVDGYTVEEGSRIIFAADEDPDVRNKIWVVNFIIPDSVPPLISQPIINLVPADDSQVLINQSTICLDGTTIQGVTFWFDGVEWQRAQLKQAIQQAPLFNVYDSDGVSFGNLVKYPSTTFNGTKLFSYAVGDTDLLDPILKFPLQYLNLNNVGDIVFENNFYKDTFLFVRDNVSTSESISNGFVREYLDRTQFTRQIGWQPAATVTQIRQQFQFVFDGAPLKLDIKVESDNIVPPLKIYVGSNFRDPNSYTFVTTDDSTIITLDNTFAAGDVVEVLALSQQTSQVGFYRVPINLEKNPLNGNSESFTLGTMRTHYESICENLLDLQGTINGANNTRDLGNINPYGLIILQQSAPLTLAGYFNRSKEYNIFAALQYNSREYTKFKNIMLEEVTKLPVLFESPGQVLTQAIENITNGRIESSPFYWSDMLPASSVFIENTYTVTVITTNVFDTVQVYDFDSANYRGILVYKNNELLLRGIEYQVANDGPRVTILVPLALGDKITIQEFPETFGSFVPNTPTKLGLYPAYRPEIKEIKTTTGTATVIVGHDGSETPIFGDIRDEVLLNFEQRIYNNLKLDRNSIPLMLTDVLPGQFRDTGYSFSEINSLLVADFLSYVGWNRINYTDQNYIPTNPFSYNYSSSQNKLTGQDLLGSWRAINRYFYDTQNPAETPWEMLGFSIRPPWWETVYGPAPYTSNNLVLWDDLEQGIVKDPAGEYVLPQYARPGLSQVIPVDSEGQLLPPFEVQVSNYTATTFQKSWSPSDGGPTEASWWNSSSYPFSVMRVLALTKPAKFYSLFADRDLYRFNTEFNQFLYNDRFRIDANGLEIYGNGLSKASFINWIVDYNRRSGKDSTVDLTQDLARLDVRLCYRMAAFSDKEYIKIYTEKSSPNSLNTTLLIPDESYNLLLYKNQPFDRLTYSSIVIQIVEGGYAVYGYNTTQPYFNILVSQPIGRLKTFTVGNQTIRVPSVYTDQVVQVPYGFVFSDITTVADFLLSYGRLLERQGLTFDNRANGYILNWDQMVREFLYWAQQGWNSSALINLNPLAERLVITKNQAVADSIVTQTSENILLDQNRKELPTKNLNIVRLDNTISLEPLTSQALSFADLRFTNFEHIIVFDNKSVFGDLIYEPITGARQSRLNLTAVVSSDWNGTVDAQGFILNENNVQEWAPLKKYTKGEIVKYKDQFWSAIDIVEPSVQFNFNDWFKSDYEATETGLLPNIANKADQLQNTYSVTTANLESDNDLLSYGLIGFRPREYMTALNLDDVSQVNVYQQFLKTKGTVGSVELLARANLGKESADYDVFENWAVQRSVYGANANRSFIEMRLDRSVLNSNPSLVQVVQPQELSLADQQVLLSQLWRQSYKITSPDFLPTTTVEITDTSLPTAGYVNFEDVDITAFDINNVSALNEDLDRISSGATLWAAKVNNYDWNIYRCLGLTGFVDHVCDNLDGTSVANFTKPHGLSPGDIFILKFLDPEVDGVYRVLTVPSINSITIGFTFTGNRSVINGVGVPFTLTTQRVAQASDVLNLSYANNIVPGSKVWVDDDGTGHWQVLEKQDQFVPVSELAPKIVPRQAQEQFGQSISQAKNRLAALIGSPRYEISSTAVGGVYVYVKSFDETYEPVSPLGETNDAILTLNVLTSGSSGSNAARFFGTSVDFGNQSWAAAGAPGSLGPASQADVGYLAIIYRDPSLGQPGINPYVLTQLLVSPDSTVAGEFGYSVAVSADERWMYVGAPGVNKVHAYGRVEWQNQFIRTTGDGETDVFVIDGVIQINADTQLQVSINNAILTLGVDYTVAGDFSSVTFTSVPAAGSLIDIRRINVVEVAVQPTVSLGPIFFSAVNIDSFSVFVNGVLWRPNIDYTFNVGTQILTFVNAPQLGNTVRIEAKSYWQYVDTITVSGLSADARFGHSVVTTSDGRQVLIGCLNETVNGNVEAGTVYVFDRDVQRFISSTTSNTITVLGTITDPVSVIVNNKFLINETSAIVGANNTFSVSGNVITINDPIAVGDVIEIETNQFSFVQRIIKNTVEDFTNFGESVDICAFNCTLYAGAPQDSTQIWKGGSVQRSVNQSRVYGHISALNANPSLTATHTLRVNNIDVAVPSAPNNNIAGLAAAINNTVPNVEATVSDGILRLQVRNFDSAPPGNKLKVLPGTVGTAFDDIGFDTFVYTQNIFSPYPVEFAKFGASISVDDSATNIVIGAPGGTMYLPTVFDDGLADFDGNNTDFFGIIEQSGVAYTFDYLSSANETAQNPGKFVFGLQIRNNDLGEFDQYGLAVNYTDGVLMIGAPGNDEPETTQVNYGRVFVFDNPTRKPAWAVIRQQRPIVDIRLINSVFTYDRITSAKTEFFDFFDPLQGKILGAARQNIDYIGAVDPAAYNTGPVNNFGNTWTSEHVGQMWWNTSTVRFIDPNQDNIVYASRRWGQVFPGSRVDIYQWVQSTVPPANYQGPGSPLNNFSYTVNTSLGVDGTFNTFYYFWVRNITTVSAAQGKTLSAATVSRYIENPKASGIPYIAPVNASTIAIYNATDILQADDTIIHVEYDRELNNDNVHVEYELIPQDRADGFLSNSLYKKLQDSFCGVDTAGNLVPDPNLNVAERYGVQFRPRQSMFVNRFEALRNYIDRANSVLKLYPIAENRSLTILNSSEPEPPAQVGLQTVWNLKVANLEILSFQNIDIVPLGYRYLVESDSNNNGLWTIYQVVLSENPLTPTLRELELIRVQNFDTRRYWKFINWYLPGYNPSTKVLAEVPNFNSLQTLNLPVGSSVLVTSNAKGKFEIYQLTDSGWQRVALEDGTIEISAEIYNYALGRFGFDVEVFDAQYFDQEPVIETRKIIQAINEELFVDELLIERNRSLTLMFDYVLSEFSAPEWLVKTSLIDVDHRIRELVPFQNFRQDNQEFVLDYIQEVKPYHVQIREFNLLYNGFDQYFGDITDYDVPAYFNTSLTIPQYTSPILLPYNQGIAEPDNILSNVEPTDLIWSSWPYNQWFNNYLLTLESISVVNGGTGYTDIPGIVIQGDAEIPATAVAVLGLGGTVVQILLTNPGSGYRSTPEIIFVGGNGTGAKAYAVMANNLVRQFKTVIKFDRYQYKSQIETWTPEGKYENGQLVRYQNQVYRANGEDSTAVEGPTFDLENWILVDPGTLSGVDRTAGLYVAGVNEPGLDLPLLIDGIEYPGVQVFGKSFLSDSVIDAEYASEFTDIYLGTRFTDINVDGGKFIGPYEGHAPQELINGAEYDTVDFKVYTRPGSDWDGDGHGFEIVSRRYNVNLASPLLSWAGLVENPVQLVVSNVTTGRTLTPGIDYTVDWVNFTLLPIANVTTGQILDITAYELGGGSQLYRNYSPGDNTNFIFVPVAADEIYNVILFVNGQLTPVVGWEPYYPADLWNILETYSRLDVVRTSSPTAYYRALQTVPPGIDISNADFWQLFVPTRLSRVELTSTYPTTFALATTVLGFTEPTQYSWSTPQTQYFTITQAISTGKTVNLSNNLSGTNVPNIIVQINGRRLRPAEGIEWIGDGIQTSFGLPQRGGYEQSIINPITDVSVYVNDQLQVQAVGADPGDYDVTNWTGSNVPGRQVLFTSPPPAGSRILISVNTVADYKVVGNQLQLTSSPPAGGVLSVTTWNDTSQQNILTLVFQGPIITGIVLVQPYDSTDFDSPSVSNPGEVAPGLFDFSSGSTEPNNDFNLQRTGLQANRLWVTLNGERLFDGIDYTVEGQYLILGSGPIQSSDVLAVTEFTDSVVPEAIGFRIFQDMRGVQATYRITENTTTLLTQNLSADSDIVYVKNASNLTEPDLPNGVFGICTIDGERIMYRERNLANNTLVGLRRGTAGTAATDHLVGAPVYDLNRGNLLYDQYQNYIDRKTYEPVGQYPNRTSGQFIFTANDIAPVFSARAIEVYVGGIRQDQYVDVLANEFEEGLTYIISDLGDTDWNIVANTIGLTYQVNDPVKVVVVPTTSTTGTGYLRNTQYLWNCTDLSTATIEFEVNSGVTPPLTSPDDTVEVTILVKRAQSWYQPGVGEPSDGQALQETQTLAARFLRGL